MGEPEIFVLRIWPSLEGGFRASVRRVDEDEPRLFSRPDEVTRFLTERVSSPARDGGDAAHRRGDGGPHPGSTSKEPS